MGPLATGSDGGGSIRVPSALCGVVGLKASMGRIPVRGDASPLDTVVVVGPITRTVRDNAFMLNAVAGPDPASPFSLLDEGFDYLANLEGASVAGVRVAYSPDLGAGPIEPEVRDTVRDAVAVFGDELGASVTLVEVDLPDPLEYFGDWWGPQAVAGLADLEAMGVELDPEHPLLPIIDKGREMSAAEYAHVIFKKRGELHGVFAEIFREHELLMWPTTPMVAFPHPGKEGGPTRVAGEAVRFPALQNQRYTEAIAHAGYPAITVPAGWTVDGLPVGLQIAGRHGADAAVLRAAAVFEQARPWADRRPRL
jgi:Asp-tRNA(Asn)/Glu-tRNA(Gln) amidotransferase A subunit family amidase